MMPVGTGRSWLRRHRPRMWQALRMTASAVVTFALGSVLGLSQGFWAVIAAIIVIQSNIGGSLKAALEQLVGSLCGAVYGAAIAFAIPHQAPVTLGLALIIAVGPLAVLATFSPGFRIAPITAIIVLLSTIGVTLGPVGFAVERVLEVALGCAVGLAVSVLLVPARAYGSVLRVAGQVATLLGEQLEALADIGNRPGFDISALPTEIRQTLGTLETLSGEASRERRSRLADGPDSEPLSRTLARLHVDVSTLGRILNAPLPAEVHQRLAEAWSDVARAAAGLLKHIGQALPTQQSPTSLDSVVKAIAAYEAAVADVRRDGLTRDLPNDAVARVFALGFVLDQFQRNLEDLVSRTMEVQCAK
jgi:uncharacterized membrane protein YccC